MEEKKNSEKKRKNESNFINKEDESEKVPVFICRISSYKAGLVLAAV